MSDLHEYGSYIRIREPDTSEFMEPNEFGMVWRRDARQAAYDAHMLAWLEADLAKELRKASNVADMMLALALRGIRMRVEGCGCDGSPRVAIEVNGKMILEYEDDVNFNMFGGDE